VLDKWLVAKTIPILKNKGQTKDIENYRSINDLCAMSKIFDKLILKPIMEIQDKDKVDLTGHQYGFKRNGSTSTLSCKLHADYNYLSLASDQVNVSLLIKRLKINDLPDDLLERIRDWLKNRSVYITIDIENSVLFDLLLGIVQLFKAQYLDQSCMLNLFYACS
jgi:hypothetical protein